VSRRKITPETHLKAVKAYLAEEGSYSSIAKKYGIGITTLKEDVSAYKAQGILAFAEQKQNNVYAEEIRIAAVREYIKGKGSIQDIRAKYGLRSSVQLRNWIKVYNSGKGFRQKMSGGSRMKESRPTTLEERIQIAKDCIANDGNYGKTALKYKVSYQQVYQWTKKFKEMGATGLEDRRGKRLKDQTPRTREEELEIEIAKLKHELYMTQMERDLLKKLDEIERREAYRK
jgi:transposase-like protein